MHHVAAAQATLRCHITQLLLLDASIAAGITYAANDFNDTQIAGTRHGHNL